MSLSPVGFARTFKAWTMIAKETDLRRKILSCGRVTQSVERPSKVVPVWCNSTDVGSNPGRGIGVRNNCRRKKKNTFPQHLCENCGIKIAVREKRRRRY